VFRHYGNRNQQSSEQTELGVISDALSDGSDMGLFYLDTRLSETTRQYRSRLEIPATDDGLVNELFNLPGIEEVTIDQQTIILKKNGSARWDAIQSRVRQIVKNHLHTHY
jgi:Scaffold protein Nfu/NifU N terminal